MSEVSVFVSCGSFNEYHKLSGLTNRMYSGGQKSKIRVLAGLHFLWRLWGRILPCFFQLPVAVSIPWLVAATLCSVFTLPSPL